MAGVALAPAQEALLRCASVFAYHKPLEQPVGDHQAAVLRAAMAAASQADAPAALDLEQVAAATKAASLATALPLLQQLLRVTSDALERASSVLYGRPTSALTRPELCELVPAVAEVVG